MFVLDRGLIKPGKTYVCPQLWAFFMEILLWLILYFWVTGHQLCPLELLELSELLAFVRCMWAFSVSQEGHTSQRSNILIVFGRPNIGIEHFLAFFDEFDWQNLVIVLCQVCFAQRWTHFENSCHLCPKRWA